MKECFLCTLEEAEDSGIPFTYKFAVDKEKFYLCSFCEVVFGSKKQKELISLYVNETERLNVYKALRKLLYLFSFDAPNTLISHQMGVVTNTSIRSDMWQGIKNVVLGQNTSLSEGQIVDLIMSAEMLKKDLD